MQVNALGALNLTRALLSHFRERKTGTVLFISSIGPYMVEHIAGGAAYMASKAYIEGLLILNLIL